MTSPATLILKLSQLTKQSEFYLSQYLGALIHLPRVWRNLHAELHLTALTVTILQLTRQLRMSSLIRIGAPPLLKLSNQALHLKSEDEMQPSTATLPLDLTTLQKPLIALRGRALESPNTFQAITHTLFRTGTRVERNLLSTTFATTTSETQEKTTQPASHYGQPPTSPRLEDEGPAEESLRERVVERWLQQQEETGMRAMMSFVEAHKLYRELFQEFVTTSILPPNMFADRFLQTPPNLTYEQAKTDLRVRLNATPTTETESVEFKGQTETTRQKPSILLPSYITNTLWAKGSLAFGSTPLSSQSPIIKSAPNSSEVSNFSTPSFSTDLIETVTRTSDELSQYQDRVANEAYLGTARERVSLERHARLPESQINRSDSANLLSDANPNNVRTSGMPLEKVSESRETPIAGELLAAASNSEDFHLTPSQDQPEQNLRIYSPAAALYASLASHTRTPFISPTRGNGHTSTPTIHTSPLKPPFAIVRDLKSDAFTETDLKLARHDEPGTEDFERNLPLSQSYPTPIYLRPSINLPAVESLVPQRITASTLPSPSIAPTRESLSKQDRNSLDENEEEDEAEGYPEDEEEEEDAEIREQVRRFGKIIAEEARRHIGST